MKIVLLLLVFFCCLWINDTFSMEVVDVSDKAQVFLGREQGGQAGYQVNFVGDVNGDGLDDLFVSAPSEFKVQNDLFPFPFPQGRSYLIYGRNTTSFLSSQPLIDIADAVFEGSGSFQDIGGASSAGDFNGDGIGDFMIVGRLNRLIHLFYGRSGQDQFDGTISIESADATFEEGRFGIANDQLPSFGDVNGDGISDFLVSTRSSSKLVYGKSGTDQYGGSYSLAETADVVFTANDSNTDIWLSTVILPDANGDGLADLAFNGRNIFPDPTNSSGLDPDSGRGEVYMFYGASGESEMRGTIDVSNADVKFQTPRDNSNLLIVASSGDVNGDGLTDLLLANQSQGVRHGQTYLIYGEQGGLTDSLIDVETESDVVITGQGVFMDSGSTLVGGGDLNGDGFDDFIVGARLKKTFYAFLGGAGETELPEQLTTADADFLYTGLYQSSSIARLAVSIGDFDGNGLADVLFGDEGVDVGNLTNAGAAYLFISPSIVPEPSSLTLTLTLVVGIFFCFTKRVIISA